jgi:hypothetical protein
MAKKKPDPENKDLLQLGAKVRAGMLLSSYLRAIGTEVTEVMDDDVPRGCTPGMPRLISKAERLARWLWYRALPHKDDEGNTVQPDLRVVQLVMDRVEGKAGVVAEDKANDGRETVPEKVSRLGVERLNKLAEAGE